MATIEITSEITGNVWKVEVKVGDSVSEGQILVILESMKMEIPIMSTEDGTVTELRVQEGDVIQEGEVVAIISA
jgi:acetyl-CoA carboxylase biotin carboxyl carrier protein